MKKFLNKFVSPLLDRWQALNVGHQLSVMFFSRTLYTEDDEESGTDDKDYGDGCDPHEKPRKGPQLSLTRQVLEIAGRLLTTTRSVGDPHL